MNEIKNWQNFMKEIKLHMRAWNIYYKKMFKVSELFLDNTKLPFSPGILDQHKEFHDSEAIRLMQWTGKIDINGKEIYEGDIVRGLVTNNSSYVCEGIKQQNLMGKEVFGVVRYSNHYAQFYVTTDDITYLGFNTGITNIEVIGNQYENPDAVYLYRLRGIKESIKEGAQEHIDKCSDKLGMKYRLTETRLNDHLEFRKKINSLSLHDIEYINQDGDLERISPEVIEKFRLTGLNNIDFFATEYWKNYDERDNNR